ncbi:MAG: hypothetical protein RI922_1532 [Bacteroidota bacterium]|jgi:RNA polymerase sigma-70 factor (ECF subfamily)
MKESKEEKFMQLYHPINDRFERFCIARSFGIMDYKDLMHDTLIVAFEKIERISNEKSFLYFLFGTAVRILSNHRKKNRPNLSENSLKEFENKVDSTNIDLDFEIVNLYNQLAKLEQKTKECIILFEISGFSIKEIMIIQNSGESAVKQRLSRGRKELLELLKSSELINLKNEN